MSKRKALWAEVSQFACEQLEKDIKRGYFHPNHLKIIIEELYPFSWGKYCKKKGLDKVLRSTDLKEKTK